MLIPELSTWVRSPKFNDSLRAPLATNSCRWLLRSSRSPSSMVDLPRRSSIVTSPDSRIEIRSPTTPLVRVRKSDTPCPSAGSSDDDNQFALTKDKVALGIQLIERQPILLKLNRYVGCFHKSSPPSNWTLFTHHCFLLLSSESPGRQHNPALSARHAKISDCHRSPRHRQFPSAENPSNAKTEAGPDR